MVSYVESIRSEDEAKKVMLKKELDRKNQMIEEHLQRLREQQ